MTDPVAITIFKNLHLLLELGLLIAIISDVSLHQRVSSAEDKRNTLIVIITSAILFFLDLCWIVTLAFFNYKLDPKIKDWIRYLKPYVYIIVLSPGWFMMFGNAKLHSWKFGFACNMSLIMIYLHTILEQWQDIPSEKAQNIKLIKAITRRKNRKTSVRRARYADDRTRTQINKIIREFSENSDDENTFPMINVDTRTPPVVPAKPNKQFHRTPPPVPGKPGSEGLPTGSNFGLKPTPGGVKLT